MPVERCTKDGRRGYRWGKTGTCHVGTYARERAERDGDKYAGIDLVPPRSVRANDRKGLELRERFGRGGLTSREAGEEGIRSGVVRASTIERGLRLSPETIRAMVRFFARHARNADAKGSESRGFWGRDSNPSAGWVSHLLWGGDAGRRWAEARLKEIEAVEARER
jgi:hypothetical protein